MDDFQQDSTLAVGGQTEGNVAQRDGKTRLKRCPAGLSADTLAAFAEFNDR